MAGVPYSGAGSDPAVPTSVPDDYERIQSSPANFGALIGQGEQKAGAATQQLGNFYNQVAADDARNQYMQGVQTILGGTGQTDPTTGKVDTGYYGLTGADALTQREATEQKLTDLRNKVRGSLVGQSQLQFDNDTARIQFLTNEGMQRFGLQQYQTWARQTNNNTVQTNAQHAQWQPDDEGVAATSFSNVVGALAKQSQIDGTASDPDYVKGIPDKAHSIVAEARMRGMLANNSPTAPAFYDQNLKYLSTSPGFEGIKNQVTQLKGRALGQQAIAGVPQPQTQATAAPGASPPAAPDITSAIFGQESGDSNAAPTSVNGAVGPAQIIPSTFARYAQPGEVITNPADNRAVGQRIVADLENKYPNDPARVAVAYFSGPGNVSAPGSVTPWVNNTADGNGKTVSSYVSDIQNRLNGPGSIEATKANAYHQIMQSNVDPEVQRTALAYVNQQAQAAQIAEYDTAKAQKQQSDAAANTYTSRILKGDTTGITGQIADDPHLTWEAKHSLSSFAVANAKDTGDDKTYGPGMSTALKGIYAAPGDPGRITDSHQLMQMYSVGGLTLSGFEKAQQQLKSAQSPDGSADGEMIKGQLAYAKAQLSFEADYGVYKVRDPKGEAAYNASFLPAFYKAYDTGLKEGKTPYQLLSRGSADKPNPDYIVDKVIAPFKRTPAQVTADEINAGNEGGTPGGGAGSADLTTRNGLVAAVQAGQITRADGEAMALKNGWIAGPAPAVAPAPVAPAAPIEH